MSVFLQIVAWGVAIYYQPQTTNARDVYSQRTKEGQISGTPPGWLFGIAWAILYGLMTATAVIFFGNSDEQVGAFVVFLVNIVLNKIWSPVFFGAGMLGLAAWIIVAMIGTEIAFLVLVGVAKAWVPFGLYLPYLIWSVYALALNVQFWYAARRAAYTKV